MLRIVGDINLTDGYFDVGFGIGSKLAQGFNPFLGINRSDDDLWIGNFEGVAADTTTKTGAAASQFRVSPTFLKHLKHMNVYGLANNHSMQHGACAYRQTEQTLIDQGSRVFGTDSIKSLVIEHQNRKISLTGFSQRIDAWKDKPLYWHNPEYKELENEVRHLPNDAYKIAYVHWGNEFINYPSSQLKKYAHWLIDIGFDLIIGMHPHILQGYEVYNGRYIFYSLGNFVFDMAWEPTHYGAIVSVDFSGSDVTIGTEYIRIEDNYTPVVVPEHEVPDPFRFKTLNSLLSIDGNSEEYHMVINRYYKQYRKANHFDIAKKIINHPSAAFGIIKDYIKRRF